MHTKRIRREKRRKEPDKNINRDSRVSFLSLKYNSQCFIKFTRSDTYREKTETSVLTSKVLLE